MNIINFDIYKNLLKEKSGLVLTQEKSYLLESRLGPIAKKWNFATFDDMTRALQGVPDQKLVTDIVEAMTTNETFFFRDTRPFDLFKDVVLTKMKDARASQKRLRIWCAAASSGQEPYSIAMILKEAAAQFPGWKFEILATDISHEILAQARAGLYSQFEVQRGMPIQMLMKYFTQVDDKWKISDDVKSMIKYDYFNLLDPLTRLGRFDVVFCRNVLIYFDKDTKAKILDNIAGLLEKDGFLFLGGAETVLGLTNAFQPMKDQRGLYVHPDGPHNAANSAAGALA
ncbi:MAG: protein-glutamate O-methyltransferase CheR [Alphaproteobacteria bacterium]|nr:protein-glutamate O-methyltransferase CheR [Alphaproteobacteria bacterium]